MRALHSDVGRRAFLGAVWVFAIAPGCTSSPEPQTASQLNLPKWEGDMRLLYPNEIDPAAFGLTGAKPATRGDRVLWARATTSDIVGRARIRTVNLASRAGVDVYQLGIEFANPPLAAPRITETRFELSVAPTDEAYGMLKTHDMTLADGRNALTDKTFVACVKRFAGADDQIEVHFYLYPDSADVAKVIQEAVAVEEVQRQ
jgi:hypothetical protein